VLRRYPDAPVNHGIKTEDGNAFTRATTGHESPRTENPGRSETYGDAPYAEHWTLGGKPWDPTTRQHTAGIHFDPIDPELHEKLKAHGDAMLHASDVAFEPGDVITPASERDAGSRWTHLKTYSPGHVYGFKAHEIKKRWRLQGDTIYHVEPQGEPEPDPEGQPGSYRFPRAVVKSIVHDGWQRRLTNNIPEGLRGPNWEPRYSERPPKHTAGLWGDRPEGLSYTYEPSHMPEPEYPGAGVFPTDHVLKAHLPGGDPRFPVGRMMLDPQHHIVNYVGVHPEYRRRGIATGLWEHARSLGLDPKHDDGTLRPALQGPEGRAWAEKTSKLDLHQVRVLNATTGFDPDLFEGEKLREEIRTELVRRWRDFCAQHELRDWMAWCQLYFTGGEASEWSGPGSNPNGDFDMQVGIDFDEFRAANPQYAGQDAPWISAQLNELFWTGLNDHDFHPAGSPRVFDLTWYSNPAVNPDIRHINPYAAWDLLARRWAVRPKTYKVGPHLPAGVRKALEGAERYARQVLALPEPQRTREAAALFTSWHDDRSAAFGPGGAGVFDYANLRMKALEATGTWFELQDAANRLHPREAKLPKTEKCSYCKERATGRVIWAEGMAYIPICDQHEQRAKDHVGDDYCNTKPIPKTAAMYHWAPKDARDDIEQHGLDHTRAPSFDPDSHGPHGVFLHHDRATAQDWVPGIDRTHDLYEVDTHGVALHPDPYDTGDASYTPHPIPPSRIKRFAGATQG
jgi:GNAT superfamily N-acetyltransferase